MTIFLKLFRCGICGQPQGQRRPVCHACWRKGLSAHSKFCKRCGTETANRQRTLCEACREVRRTRAGLKFVGRNKMSGPGQNAEMLAAEIPLKEDLYAQTTPVISDEEFALKQEKFRALLAADVHVGSYSNPRHWHAPEAEHGSFGTLANRHMRGGEAGQGTDRTHTFNGGEMRNWRKAREAWRTKTD